LNALAGKTDEVDAIVQSASPRWKIARMAVVDRNILRIGVLELLQAEIPPKDTIYDCVALARQYGDKDSYRFVNGLLDQVCKDRDISL
jgi:N utilization substance protein B